MLVYPMSGADGLVGGPWAGAEIELLDGETFVIETDVVRPAGRPVLNVSQISVSIDQHVSAAENRTQHSVRGRLWYSNITRNKIDSALVFLFMVQCL